MAGSPLRLSVALLLVYGIVGAFGHRSSGDYYVTTPASQSLKVTQRVFFDITVDGKPIGRITFGLFGDAVPRTVNNFVELAKSKYKGTRFHHVVRDIRIDAGDWMNRDGTGLGGSIYQDKKMNPVGYFDDESFEVKHFRGVLSMGNFAKPHTNGAQFSILLTPEPTHLRYFNEKHVAFGMALGDESWRVLRLLNEVPAKHRMHPLKEIIVQEAGISDDVEEGEEL